MMVKGLIIFLCLSVCGICSADIDESPVTIQARSGEQLSITLPAVTETEWRWTFDGHYDHAIVTFVKEDLEAGKQVFIFTAKEKGQTDILFKLMIIDQLNAPFAQAEKTYTVTVE